MLSVKIISDRTNMYVESIEITQIGLPCNARVTLYNDPLGD